MKKNKIYLFVALIFSMQLIGAQQVPTLKNPNEAVQDYVNLFSEQERYALNEKLRIYSDSTSTGIVIAILPTTDDDINFHAAEILAKWGIGQKGKDNGVLILMAYQQRKVAISTGYGVEEHLTDALCSQIISQDMIPYFKTGAYYQGFDKATTSIMQVLSGNFKPEPVKEDPSIFITIIAFAVILWGVYLAFKNPSGDNGKDNNQTGGGFDIFDMIILSNIGRSSGGFGGSGGSFSGGFGGFGGGSGGGGGASGSW